MSTGTTGTSRQERRRQATRARLLDATRLLVAERGIDAVTIADISTRADLGAGTFYNYFRTRDEIVDEIMADTIESIGARNDEMARGLADPAEIFAASLRHVVRSAVSDPMSAWFLVRLGVAHPRMIEILGPRAGRDLRRGMDGGRFTIPDLEVAVSCTFGALLSTLHLALGEDPPPDVDQLFARNMLAMVGLGSEDAAEVSSRPLPG